MFRADLKKIVRNQNVLLNIPKKRISTKAKSSKEKTEKKNKTKQPRKQTTTKNTQKRFNQKLTLVETNCSGLNSKWQ